MKELLKYFLKIKIIIGGSHSAIQLMETVQHITFQFGHILMRHTRRVIIVVQIAEQKADGVAQLAVGIHIGLDDSARRVSLPGPSTGSQ